MSVFGIDKVSKIFRIIPQNGVLRKSLRKLSAKASKDTTADDDDMDKPIKFSTSKAATFSASQSLGGNPFPNAPWYQPQVVVWSVGIFLLYFLALREENDIDEEMALPLWERIPGLEKQQLNVVLEYNRSHKLDTADIEQRLKEIDLSRSAQQK